MYDVVAVLGSSSSDESIAATRLLGAGRVPMVSVFATSDELSNSQRYPYFLRVVPPGRFQFRAIAELIKTFNWTFISVVYEEGSYGEHGFIKLSESLEGNDVCFSVAERIQRDSNEQLALVCVFTVYTGEILHA
ncbi:hypothetical protein ACOMHN_036947 [Nucella lapillus]